MNTSEQALILKQIKQEIEEMEEYNKLDIDEQRDLFNEMMTC